MLRKSILLAVLLIILISISAFAYEAETPSKSVISGFFELGVLFIDTSDKLYTGDENRSIDDLNGNGERVSEVKYLPLFELRYSFEDSNTSAYIGTPLEDSGIFPTVGLTFDISEKTQFDISIYSEYDATVWRNPYLINSDRKTTAIDRTGVKLEYKNIADSNFTLSYDYKKEDVKHDDIGLAYDDLKRDGYNNSFEIGYKMDIGSDDFITPKFNIKRAEIEGKSNSYDGYELKLHYLRERAEQRYILNIFVSANKNGYGKTHPIFNQTRADESYTAIAIYTLLEPFDFKDCYINYVAVYSRSSSNIDFFDKETRAIALGFGYRL